MRATLGLLAVLASPLPAFAEQPRAVLELFTSQGCASCPAADALLGELAQRDGILAVTMPVKLWDFLGWADTLASDVLTKRQIAYSVARGDRDVYTPQMVVNGADDVLGSDMAAIRGTMDRVAAEPLPVPIDLAINGDVLTINVATPAEGTEVEKKATLWLMVVEEEVRVPVDAGENRGRRLTYHNVVRSMRPIGMWKGKPMTFDLPLADVEKMTAAGCAVIAQVDTFKGPGRIIGAASLDRLFPARTAEKR
nr:DUF1223 domain-containing protein [Acuticoccus mangrovi]